MKKIIGLFLFPLCFTAVSCGTKSVKVSTTSFNCTFDNVTTAKKGENLNVGVKADKGYILDQDCFKVLVGSSEVNDSFEYSNDKLLVKKNLLNDDITIIGTAKKDVCIYDVKVTFDKALITPYEKFPETVLSTNNLNLKFNVKSGYGFDAQIKVDGESINDFDFTYNGSYISLNLDTKYIVGDIDINLNAVEGKITLTKNKVDIKNYDTSDVYVYNPLGNDLSYTKDDTSDKSFNITKLSNGVRIDSLSNNICENKTITVSNGTTSEKITVNIYHPKNVQEALDSTTLGFIRDNDEIELTFNYNNNESFNSFASHLEITENMYSSTDAQGFVANYYNGENKTNTFKLLGINKHGRDYGTKNTTDGSKLFKVTNGNYIIGRTALDNSTSTIALDNSSKSMKVYNSEELFWVVEHGYIPTFADTTGMGAAQKKKVEDAKTIYEMGRKIITDETRDSMEVFDEVVALFNYLENLIVYDHEVTGISEYLKWLQYSSYFMEGVFLNNGLAVCDGFSKSFAFLCGLDNLPVIRSFGYSSESGHAWNYVNIDNVWYLVCPTWAIIDVSSDLCDIYGKDFKINSYNSFLRNKYYFNDSENIFTDDAFPLINKSNYDYRNNIYNYIKAGNTNYNYNVNLGKDSRLVTFFNILNNSGYSNKPFFINFYSDQTENILQSFIKSSLDESSLKFTACNLLYNSEERKIGEKKQTLYFYYLIFK